eukprot:4438741-Prorocentrum_lima.AAC.1
MSKGAGPTERAPWLQPEPRNHNALKMCSALEMDRLSWRRMRGMSVGGERQADRMSRKGVLIRRSTLRPQTNDIA